MNNDEVILKMKKAIEYLEEELSKIRAGRANPAILDGVKVEYYGSNTPINQLATVSVPEARQIQISPWDKNMLSAIERAINIADIGLTPMNDGASIRLNFPELNEMRRKELVKECKSLGENTKVTIRNIRRDVIDHAKKDHKANEITEDELKLVQEEVQILTDKYVKEVDEIITNKEKDIMEV